jgi:hypothetical protein
LYTVSGIVIDAVDRYEASLNLQQRDEAKFRELLVRLRKALTAGAANTPDPS